MNYALYTAFLGMRSRQRTLDAQANNIANASTTGYKAERLLYRSVEAQAENKTESNKQLLAAGVLTESSEDFSPGAVRETGRSLDIALDGDAFLAIQTPRGTRYARAGNLTLDSAGQLVTHNGDLVVGESGAITIPPGNISIGEDGTIASGGQTIDRLKLVRFNNPTAALIKEGDSLYAETGKEKPQEAVNTRVLQGALEQSNINPISEMVAMMQNSREFDSLQKAVSTMMNDLGRKVSGEIGKI